MSDLGGPSHTPAPQGPGRGRALLVVGVVLVLLLVGGGVAALLLGRHQSGGEDGGHEDAISYPKTWDPRIKPYADIAAKQRDLTFRHPVAVRFLAPAAFEKTLETDRDTLSKDDETDLEHDTALLRALGLISGDVDLFAAVQEATGGGTLAYYSFEDKRITVRGSDVTPAVRATLVHELTHALQDQHFDVGDRTEKLSKESEDGTSTDSEATVLDAVIEGDAERVAELYRASLPARERKAMAAAEEADQKDATARLAKVPKFVTTMMSAPYVLGQALVEAVAKADGNKGVDELYSRTPEHDTALTQPLRQVAGTSAFPSVSRPALRSGEKKFDAGEFGALTWYLVLAERLPLRDALAAADGWGEDAYVGYTDSEGKACMRIDYRGATTGDTDRMGTALQRWIASTPGSTATVTPVANRVELQSCDPGTGSRGGKDASQDALELVATRAYVGIALLGSGAPAEAASCLSGKLVDTYSVKQLTDPEFGAGDPAVQRKIQQLAAGCR
jgi:hypothetical protein